MAASSSSPLEYDPFSGLQCKSKRKSLAVSPRLYDVFINHRGPDIKKTLAHSLYNRLKDLGKVFLDSPELELGEWFPSSIENAIASSWLHIAVFSKTYAESPWCLAELAFMLKTSVKLIPVFYDVEPSELRYIEQGKGSYAHAFTTYEKKERYLDRLQEWKDALRAASFITGLDFRQYHGNNEKLCEDIVREVLKEKAKRIFLQVAESPVGLDQLVEEFEMVCKQKEEGKATVVGIYGMGGSGKTTLAKELFNRWKAKYNGWTFLFDVREASVRRELPSLQAKLLKDLVNEDRPKLQSVDEGISYLMDRLKRGDYFRFLIVVDDIDHKNQLNALVPRDILNPDSLIIVTTRDESVLREAGITLRYKMKVMNTHNSRKLFCWTAFRQPAPPSGYKDLVDGFVEACGGLPLSLHVMGGHVFGNTHKGFWELELNKVRQTLDGNIKKSLRISFDGLDSHEQQIFMDIACFFIGSETSAAIKIWKRSGWSAEHAIRRLKDKCLIEEERLTGGLDLWDTSGYVTRPIVEESPAERDFTSSIWSAKHAIRRLKDKRLIEELPLTGGLDRWDTNQYFTDLIVKESLAERDFASSIETYPEYRKIAHIFEEERHFVNRKRSSWAESAIRTLKNKLIGPRLGNFLEGQSSWTTYPTDGNFVLRMHEHLRDLGREMAEEFRTPFRWWRPGFLESLASKGFEYILSQVNGSSVRCIHSILLSDTADKITYVLGNSVDCPGPSTALLYLELKYCRCTSIPSWIPLQNLLYLRIHQANLKSLWESYNQAPLQLKELELSDMEDLTEFDLRRVTSLDRLSLRGCHRLKRISGDFDHLKLVTLQIRECLELEEMPNLALLHCVKRITIDDGRNLHNTLNIPRLQCLESVIINLCPKLQYVTGIGDLEGLKCLHLFAGNRAVRNCIADLKRLPSEVTSVMVRAYDGIEATLTPTFFRDVIDKG